MKQILTYLIIFFTLFYSCNSNTPDSPGKTSVIPKPAMMEKITGDFVLTGKTAIAYDEGLSWHAGFLSAQIETITGIKPDIPEETKAGENSIYLKFDNKIKEQEGYHLEINNSITIASPQKAGILNGIQSLLQIIAENDIAKNKTVILPNTVIDDHPAFRWRGMHLDVSRHFFTKDEVKKYIDILAMHKLNVFHWHLTDDQGWRIEIKRYPKLTSVGAWRKDRRGETWNISDDQRTKYDKSKALYGGFYTQKDVKEIVRYAQERNITIIPEIEMPGHSCAALVAYPEYSCFGYAKEVPSGGYVADDWDFSDPYCAGNDETFVFLQNILDEIIDLFPSEYIHIGGDECSKRRWKQCPRCQARIKNEGLKDETELQSYFIRRIEKYLDKKGRKIIGWEEILEGGIDPSAAIMPWKWESATGVCVEAANTGHNIVMAPAGFLYFNTQWPGEKEVHSKSTDLEKVYSFDPFPAGLSEENKKAIIGVEACAWSEYMLTFDDVMHQTLPRMAALAETAWSNPKHKNFDDFKKRLDGLKALYSAYGLHYHVQVPLEIKDKTVFTDKAVFNISSPSKELILHYTTDNTAPTLKSPILNKSLIFTETTTLKIASFDRFGQRSRVKTAIFEKQDFKKPDIVKTGKYGVRYRLISGKFRSAEKVKGTAVRTGLVRKIIPVNSLKKDGYGIIFNGYIMAPEKGIYTFYLRSSDGSILKIGGNTVVNNDGFHDDSRLIPGQTALDKGLHRFTLKYFKWNKGKGSVKLYLEYPGTERQEAGSELFFID